MKRTLTAILLCVLLTLTLFGCGSEQLSDADVPDDGADTTVLPGGAVETPQPEYAIYLNAYEEAGGRMSVTETDGSGAAVTNCYGGIGLMAAPGDTVGQALAGADYADLTPFADGDTFEGWMEYTETVTTDDNGLESFFYALVSDRVYSLQELMELPVEHDANYVAKWATVPAEQYFLLANRNDRPSDTLAFAFSASGGNMSFMEAEGAEYTAATYVYWLEPGQALNDIMGTASGAALIDIFRDDCVFDGWTLYEADSASWSEEPVEGEGITCLPYDDGAGWNPTYLLLENAEIIRDAAPTEELCGFTVQDKCYFAVANWDDCKTSTASGN